MTSEDIVRMAREAGVISGFNDVHPSIERFAALVAAAERERIIAENAPVIEKINAHIKALAEMKPCNKSCAPGYCYCECPHGVTDGNYKECYGKATNSEPFTVYTTLRQRGIGEKK